MFWQQELKLWKVNRTSNEADKQIKFRKIAEIVCPALTEYDTSLPVTLGYIICYFYLSVELR